MVKMLAPVPAAAMAMAMAMAVAVMMVMVMVMKTGCYLPHKDQMSRRRAA